MNCATKHHQSFRNDSRLNKLTFFPFVAVCLGVFLLALQQQTLAQSIGSLPGWDGNQEITGFSDSGNSNSLGSTTTVGETFVINNANALVTSIAFPVYSGPPEGNPGPSYFQVGVAAWNGTRPTGPLLYLSGQLVGSDNMWKNFTVTPSNLHLNQGQQYVLFFTGLDYLDGLDSQAGMGYIPGNPYPDGQYFSLGFGGSGLGINDVFQNNWTGANVDLAFEINYTAVPEPAGPLLLGLGLTTLIFHRRILFRLAHR